MAVQYNPNNKSWSGLITDIYKAKTGIYNFNDEITEFISKTKDWNFNFIKQQFGNNEKSITDWINALELSDEDFKSFLKTWDGVGNISYSYQQWVLANGKATSTFSTLTAKAGATLKSLGAALASMGINWGISALVSAAVDLFDSLHTSLKEQQEITEDLQDELSDIRSEIADVNSELHTTADRINELNSKDSLSFIEKEELENLTAANKELERKNWLLAEQENLKQQETALSVRKEFDKKYGNLTYTRVRPSSEDVVEGMRSKRERYYELYHNDYRTDKESEELYRLKQELEEWDRTSSSFTEHVDELISAYTDLNQKKLEGTELTEWEKTLLKNYKTELVGTALDMEDYSERYEIDDSVSQSWKALSESISECLYPARYHTDQFNQLFNSLPDKMQSKLTDLAQKGELSADNLITHLTDSFMEDFTNAGFQAEEVVQQIYAALEESAQKNPSSFIFSVTDTLKQITARLSPVFDSLKSAWQNIFTDGTLDLNSTDILSLCSSIESSLNHLNEMDGITVDYAPFENLVAVLNNTEAKEWEVKDAFDSLASSITQAALTGTEDFETMKAALEDLGVSNSETAAFNALIHNTEALKEAGLDLAEASYPEMVSFARAQVSAENFTKALFLLRVQKLLCKDSPLSTAGDVQNLLFLAQAAGIAADSVQALFSLSLAYTKAAEEGDTLAAAAARGQMELVRKQVIDQFSSLGSEIDFEKTGGGAAPAGTAAARSYTDAFEEELHSLEDLKADGLLSEKQYLDKLRLLYEHYFKDKLGYEKEYAKYQRQYLDGYKSLYESVFSHAAGLIDDKIDGMQEERDAAVASLEAQKKAAEDSYNAQIKLLEDKKDVIQEEIDKIREANEDRKEAITLQEKERNLARAENQKTILQYTEGRGFFYTADAEAVQTARKELDDVRTEAQIRVLDKQQDVLDKQIDNIKELLEASNAYWDAQIGQTNHYYDALIKGMEGYRDRFSSLSGLQEHARMIALLQELGYTEADLLDQNSGALERLMHSYLGILKDMSGNDSGILGELSGLIGIDMNTVPGFLEQMEQQVHGITDAFDGKEEGTGMTGAIQKAINKIGAAGSEEEDPESLLSALSAQTDAALDEETGIPAQTAAWENMNGPLDHSLDTVSALKSTLEEMDGKVYSVALNITGAGAALGIAGAGTTLGKQLVSQYKTDGKASKSDTSGDKNIPIPLQKGDPFYDIMEKAKNLVPDLSANNAALDQLRNMASHSAETILSHINYINNNANRTVTQNIKNINQLSCPNVTNSSGVEYIQRELGNLSSRALQEAYKS